MLSIQLQKTLHAETESLTQDHSSIDRAPSDRPSPELAGGTEWVIDARGCPAVSLRDRSLIVSICQAVIDDLDLNVVGQPLCHQFPGAAGVTALFMLSESHLACHTYPEHRFATFNLYCCRRRASWNWQHQLADRLGAAHVSVREIDRSIVPEHTQREGQLR